MNKLLQSLKLGDLNLPNRIIMAPLTRMRALPGNIPHELNANYYVQRATAGLIISEATQISQQGQGYPATPGIHSKDQTKGWQLVTNAVHNAGGRMFLQLWHVGRISHSSHQPDGGLPVAPSAIAAQNSGTFTADWKPTPILIPRALELTEIPGIVSDYKHAALNAKTAGFDGVEVHGANGYLLDQFLQDGSNHRTDSYGGSIENRARLLLEVVDAVIEVWGKDRVGVRLSPYGSFNDMHDSNPLELFSYVIKELDKRQIAYVHLIEPRVSNAGSSDAINTEKPNVSKIFRSLYNGTLLSAGGYTPESGLKALEQNDADAIVFGRIFISNPDLVARIDSNAALNKYDRSTFYGGNLARK